jgi:hypothetical protein
MVILDKVSGEDFESLKSRQAEKRKALESAFCDKRGRIYDGIGLPEDLDDEVFYLCQEEEITYLEALRAEEFPTLAEGLAYINREKEDHKKLLGRLSAPDLETYLNAYADLEFDDRDLFVFTGQLDVFESYLADKWVAEVPGSRSAIA